ncbi:MAG TPA: efflux RND transporter permease subunit [Bacteroidales bacterium]|nr:efflux RND transporter permease subunit [Bacteroidales bacterium]
MKLPKIAVNRPVSTLMAFMAVLVMGTASYFFLPRDVLPNIELPSLTIITVYPGASAEEVEQQVTRPLERVLAGAQNMKKISSVSRENVSLISLQFNWGTDVTDAANNARDLIELVKSDLPSEAQQPYIMKLNNAMMPVVIYGITAKESYPAIEKIIEDNISSPLRKVEGVGTVLYIAQPSREIRIEVDPFKMQTYHLSISRITEVLKLQNTSIPGGVIKTGDHDFSVKIPEAFSSADDIRKTVISSVNGQIIRMEDIATVTDDLKEKDEIARTNGTRAVALFVQKQSGSNTLQVYKAVAKTMASIQKNLPHDVQVKEIINSAEVINKSLGNLSETLWYAAFFVILVVIAFLREWRSSLIVIVTIPFSLIVAFIMMYALGYTINIFSMMALVIAIGMVVDDAIVVIENISRHVEKGSRPREAAIFATMEMGRAIVASTLTIVAVFVPMFFIGGIVGIMFKQLAVITTVTMLASLATALSLTPMLASVLLKPVRMKKENRFYKASERFLQSIENGYQRSLKWAIHNRYFLIGIVLIIAAITIWQAAHIGTDYIPEFDAGDVVAVIEAEPGTSAEETERIAMKVEEIFRKEIPEQVSSYTIAGQTEKGILTTISFAEGKNVATIGAHLVLPENRQRSAAEIAEAVRKQIAQIPEIEKFHVTGGSMLSSALLGNVKPVEIKITGNNIPEMTATAEKIREAMNADPVFSGVESSSDQGTLELQIHIDQDRASELGLNTALIALQIRQALYGADAGELKEEGDNYNLVVRYKKENRKQAEDLKNIMISTLSGKIVPLSSLAEVTQEKGLTEIRRESQQRIVKVVASVNNVSLSEAANHARKIIRQTDIPENISVEVGGQVSEQKESFNNLWLIFVLGILMVYMIMAAQFESVKDPFIIFFAIPFGLIGIVWALKITGLTLSVVTFIGMIMLLGIVVRNGIILVDYTNLLLMRNLPLEEAVTQAGRSRLRPVLMTSLVAILGMIPMAASSGMGSEMWSPLGITLIGGLTVSLLITLILVPVIYYMLHIRRQRNAD